MVMEDIEEKKGSKITENIILGTDGKYHWCYEYGLLRNPTILLLIWKIFFWINAGIWLMLVIVGAFSSGFDWKDFMGASKLALLMLALMEVLAAIGYFVYAAILGFRYCVIFEMDESGVTHTQMRKQFKKAQAVSYLAAFMGIMSGRPGTMASNLTAASRQSMSSSWSQVRNVVIISRRNVIKIDERLGHNQVYALPQDFPFVEQFIRTHVTKKCKIIVKESSDGVVN